MPESDQEADIGDILDFPEDITEEDFENIGEESNDDFNLHVSLAILDTETDELDAEFLEAGTEIEGKKSFRCSYCNKVCKSKGGLTKHTNSKHREVDVNTPTESYKDTEVSLSLENLAGIVEAIKVRLIAEDLYGPEINTAVKNASCNKSFFDAVLPLYNKFCRKRNQDKLHEAFYELIPNSSQYLNCPDSNATNLIMIEIPDRLVGFFKVCQHREKAGAKPTETNTSDIKLDTSERGPLSYVAGYIVSKLYQKTRSKNQNECDEELQALLQALKSTESDNNFILARSRGGLVSPGHHLMGIVEEAEFCFRKNINTGDGELVLRNILVEIICESTLSSPVVRVNIKLSCEITLCWNLA